MKLTHSEIKYQIEADNSFINTVVVEDPVIFRNAVNELQKQCNGISGKFILSDSNKEIAIHKKIELILNPFDIDINSKKVLSKVYEKLEALAVSEDLYTKTKALEQQIISYLEELDFRFSEPVEFDLDLNITSLFKAVNVYVESGASLPESLDRYMRLSNDFLGLNWFFFVNLKSYLSPAELRQLFDSAAYNKYYITLVESRESDEKCEFEKLYILDKDFCEIW